MALTVRDHVASFDQKCDIHTKACKLDFMSEVLQEVDCTLNLGGVFSSMEIGYGLI